MEPLPGSQGRNGTAFMLEFADIEERHASLLADLRQPEFH